jgi:PhzF family phenazine biosynthesis protein
MTIPYFHVDSFTSELFSGNPAGVCILTAFPPDGLMQRIAVENRHSNTAFVVRREDRDFDLRWFTPQLEDDLCGHATLASAFVLAFQKHDEWPVRFHTRSGVLIVRRDSDAFEMDFPSMPAQSCEVPAGLLAALGLKAAQVTKARDYLVVVERSEQVRALAPDIPALAKLDIGLAGAIVTAPGDGDADYVSRFFAPSIGIDEDPATGSIHCTLAPYWAGRLGKPALTARQLSQRGGEFRCQLDGDRVRIAGSARLYMQGTIRL